jgi:hypothetical protein
LQRPELEHTVQNNLLRMAAPPIAQDTLLVIGPSDLSKKYDKEMEYLATVRDGSAHDLAKGYWTLHVIGIEVASEQMVPLYQRVWSTESLRHSFKPLWWFVRALLTRYPGQPNRPP